MYIYMYVHILFVYIYMYMFMHRYIQNEYIGCPDRHFLSCIGLGTKFEYLEGVGTSSCGLLGLPRAQPIQ